MQENTKKFEEKLGEAKSSPKEIIAYYFDLTLNVTATQREVDVWILHPLNGLAHQL